jgi:ABC-type branched-subunit amino acid transport system ATPase component
MALVGGNGAGKSTLVKLLLRFCDPGTVAPTTTPSIRKSRIRARDARAAKLRKSCNEIESKNRPSDLGVVILAWQTYPLRAVPPALRASHTRLTTRKAVPSPTVGICIDCLKGRS